MTHKQKLLIGYKTFFALLGLSAIVTEIAVIVERGKFFPANFFSFFTVETNIFAAAMLLISAGVLLRGKPNLSVTMLRGAATLYMLITGIVFSLLLAGLDVELTAVPWDNIVLHYIMPVAIAVDWLLDRPKKKISFKAASVWLIYPLVYVVYSLVRGAIVGWYPYPFLNPATNGIAGLAGVSVGILLLALVLVWLLTRLRK